MISGVFHAVIYEPLYNALVFLIDIVPGGNVGVAIIILTIFVKLLMFPLARRATQTQLALKKITPLLEEVKQKHKDDQQEQVKQTFALYKEYKVNPLSGIFILLIQLPIIIGLYRVFIKGDLPVIHAEKLYSFISMPGVVDTHFFFNLVDMGGKSIVLAILAGATQFAIAHMTFEAPTTTTKPGESMKDDIMRSLHLQTKYVLPVIIGVFAYMFSAAVALHWTVGNIFTLIQDYFVRRQFRAKE